MVTLSAQLGFGSKPRAGIARLVVTGAVIAGLTLSGCAKTSNPEPTTLKPTTQTSVEPEPTETTPLPEETTPNPTQKPSAAPTPPDPAQLINENTEEGAKSAATYFLDLRHYVFRSQDDALWKQLSTDECEVCKSVSKGVADLRMNGLVYEGGGISKLEIQSVEEPWPTVWRVEVRLEENAARTQVFNGDSESEFPSSDGRFFIFLRFDSEQWLLDEIAK